MHENGSYAGVRTMAHGEVEDQEDEWLLRRAQEVVANSARLAARIAVAEKRKMAGQHKNGRARGGSEASGKSSVAAVNKAVPSELQGAQEPRRLCPSFQGQQSEIADVIVRNGGGLGYAQLPWNFGWKETGRRGLGGTEREAKDAAVDQCRDGQRF